MKRRAAGVALRWAVLVALAFPAGVARAGWGPDPVQVYSTPNVCKNVAACEDGAFGAHIAWQEGDAAIRTAHVLATGELESNWLPSMIVTPTIAIRTGLAGLPDGKGGAYWTWAQYGHFFMQHIDATGDVHPGWPPEGRSLAWFASSAQPPVLIRDGEDGFYLAWLAGEYGVVDERQWFRTWVSVVRLGPDGLVREGWPAAGLRFFAPPCEAFPDSVDHAFDYSISRAPDGSVWVAWTSLVGVPQDRSDWSITYMPGGVQVSRCQPDGTFCEGWDSLGVRLATFPGEITDSLVTPYSAEASGSRVIDVLTDGTDGAFVLYGQSDPQSCGGYDCWYTPVLVHVDDHGRVLPALPPRGLTDFGYPTVSRNGMAAAYRLIPGADGEIYIGFASNDSHGPQAYLYVRRTPEGATRYAGSTLAAGLAVATTGVGQLAMGSIYQSGPVNQYDARAHVICATTTGAHFSEDHDELGQSWYGAIGLAGMPDGGAIFCWSQHNGRHGVYAVRLGPTRLITNAPTDVAVASRSLGLTFVPDRGVRARLAIPGTGEAKLLLADVTGRAVARETFALGAGTREWTIVGTATLAPGLYFARVTRGAETLTARVVVAR